MVPPGEFSIVLDPDGVQHGWGNDELERGVYLPARDVDGLHPPKPVAVDDRLLKFGAEAALLATDRLPGDEEIIAVRKSSWGATLIIVVEGGSDGTPTVFNGGDDHMVGAYPSEQPDLFEGFWHIRKKGTPSDIYTHAEAPRLRLRDLDYTIGQAGDGSA